MIRQTIAAVAVLIAATIVSLTPNEPASVTPTRTTSVPVQITSTPVLTEDDPAWDCHLVTEHSNGVCGSDLPQGVTAADFPQCTDHAAYHSCPAAVRNSR